MKLFFEQYNVYDVTYNGGWAFREINGLFNDYIDKWIKRKNEATISGNKGQRTLAKLMLNSLYGKFATSLEARSKMPYLGDDGIIHYETLEKEEKNGLYIPVGCFITSYAREKTIRTSQAIKDYSIKKYGKDLYIYSDTDSIHTLLPIEELKQFCEIDDVELGKWKHEGSFIKAKFIRQKCYIEKLTKPVPKNKGKRKYKIINYKIACKIYKYGEVKITCAGMPSSCYKYVTWEKFKTGFSCGGKLVFKHVKGGVKLVETDFTIKDEKLFPMIKGF